MPMLAREACSGTCGADILMRFDGESVGRGLVALWLASGPWVLRSLAWCARTSACAAGPAARDQPSPPAEDQAREIELRQQHVEA